MNYTKPIFLFATLFFINALRSGDATNPCVASTTTNSSTFTWSTDDEKLKFLKVIKEYAEKVPVIKEVEVSASASGSLTTGEECCDSASDPSKYEEYSGSGSVDVTLKFIGLGGKLTPSFSVPVWWGYSLAGELYGEASISGGGSLSGSISVSGKTGDCGCLTVGGSASASPTVEAKVGGRVSGGVFSNSDPLKPVAGISTRAETSASVTTTLKVANFQKSFGDKCDNSSDGLKFCWELPSFNFTATVELPLGLPDYSYEFSWDIFATFGAETSGCVP
jgi:hypothetical protein